MAGALAIVRAVPSVYPTPSLFGGINKLFPHPHLNLSGAR